jgi:rare lipoprotein A
MKAAKTVLLRLFLTGFFFSFMLRATPFKNEEVSSFQSGRASYYASMFDGRKTASGEIFRNDDYTCAHRTLPFGTVLKVTNPSNESYVYVTVNDRGPFSKGRIIDLSRAAALDLDMVRAGTAFVNIEVVTPHEYQPEVEEPRDEINKKYRFEDI